MKKLFVLCLFLFLTKFSFAQFNQGRMLLGGGLGFQSNTSKVKGSGATVTEGRGTIISVNPRFGYFFIDNLAGGLSLEISSSTEKPEGSNDKFTATAFAVSPFVRYYIKPGIFVQGEYGFGSVSEKATSGNSSNEETRPLSRWSLGAGYALFLNDHVAVEPFVGYQSLGVKDSDVDVRSVNAGLFINLGIQVYLGDRN